MGKIAIKSLEEMKKMYKKVGVSLSYRVIFENPNGGFIVATIADGNSKDTVLFTREYASELDIVRDLGPIPITWDR